jgi:hypothetical protein
MNKLQPNERVLTGRWLTEVGHMRGDAICERIEGLIAHHLQKVATSPESAVGRRSTGIPATAAIGNGLIRKAKCTGRRS